MIKIIEFVIIAIIAYILLSIKAFNIHATIIGIIFSLAIWKLLGFYWFVILFAFLFLSILATYYHYIKKGEITEKSRELDNVVSNGLVPFMAAVFATSEMNIFLYIFLGSISAALADTLSSEIGSLSTKYPILITNPTIKVNPGTNGGISLLGEFASLFGALVIATLSYLFFFPSTKVFLAILLAGFVGSTIDSIFGATLENKKLMNNGTVNFVSTLIGGLTAVLIVFWI